MGVPDFVLPHFSAVCAEAKRVWQVERLVWHTGITAAEVVTGFALGSLLGALMGYALGMSPRVEAVLSPYLLALQIAPKVAFAPLFVMWLGYTMYPKILVAVLIVFFPVLINVLSAMRNMDHDLINLARSFSASRLQVFRTVQYPTTLPSLFSGLRIASTLAVIGVVVGELVGGNMGLGFLLVFFEGQGNTAGVFVVIAALTVIGIVAYYAVVWAERRVLHYLPSKERRVA
jgi:NitT/TauT family transport system permease protein